jgi:hypothetical protein
MIVFCKICKTEFYPRPSHVKKGWGIYCSRNCKNIGTRIRQKVFCYICNKELQKTVTQINHSKSGKYFCDKSCQTKWRNREYVGGKHKGFKDGNSVYQSILRREGGSQICGFCGETDVRVLSTHHVDENHKNNDLKNLAWLCRNCHTLVHYANVEKQKFFIKHDKRLSEKW